MIIFIPAPLRPHAGGKDNEINAATTAEALNGLTGEHPDLRRHLFTAEGKLRAFVNLYLNDEDVRYLPAKETAPVAAAGMLAIIPSIAGGRPMREAAPLAHDLSVNRHIVNTSIGPWQP